MASTGTVSAEVPTEDRDFIEQLAKLQNIHDQIHDLRGLLPERLLKPTRAVLENPNKNSPAKLAADLRHIASQGSKDIRRFAADFRNESMQQLWQKTSTGEFPQGRDAWTVNYERLLQSAPQSNTPPTSNENGGEIKIEVEDIDDSIKNFQEANPTIKLDRADLTSTFPLQINISGLRLRITRAEKEEVVSYHVETSPESASDLSADVVKAVENSGSHQNLALFLSMLASYKGLKFRPCDKCKAIFDQDVTYPIIRKQRSAAGKADASPEWIALHRGCTS